MADPPASSFTSNEDDLELITDNLIKDADSGNDPPEQENVTTESGPVTTYNDLFQPDQSSNLLEVPNKSQFDFHALSSDKGKVKGKEVVSDDKKTVGENILEEEEEVVEEEVVEEEEEIVEEEIVEEEIIFENETKKDQLAEDDQSLTQKSVQFSGLPDNPPELTIYSVELQPMEIREETFVEEPLESSQESLNLSDHPSDFTYESIDSKEEIVIEEFVEEEELSLKPDSKLKPTEVRNVVQQQPSSSSEPAPNPTEVHKIQDASKANDPDGAINHTQSRTEYVDPENLEVSEPSTSDDEVSKGDSALSILVVVIFSVLILASGALVLVFVSQSENERPSEIIPITVPPTFLSTLAPSDIPTSSASPTITPNPTAPTFSPTESPTREPTLSPTRKPTSPSPTRKPTLSPILINPPDNDQCVNAIGPLPSDGSSISGTILGAQVDNVDVCGAVAGNGNGVWYYTLGTGGEMMAHTCFNTVFDSQISIYRGSCSNPECLESNDEFCGSQSAVSWQSNHNEVYRILVHGPSNQPDKIGSGSFDLTISQRYNDECSTAIGPLTVGPELLVIGDTLSAYPNDDISCDGQVNDSPSVFYLVGGTGREMTASVCADPPLDFNARISILTGTCSNLVCLIQSNGCEITWQSSLFQDYYIMVHGETDNDKGNFGLGVTTTV